MSHLRSRVAQLLRLDVVADNQGRPQVRWAAPPTDGDWANPPVEDLLRLREVRLGRLQVTTVRTYPPAHTPGRYENIRRSLDWQWVTTLVDEVPALDEPGRRVSPPGTVPSGPAYPCQPALVTVDTDRGLVWVVVGPLGHPPDPGRALLPGSGEAHAGTPAGPWALRLPLTSGRAALLADLHTAAIHPPVAFPVPAEAAELLSRAGADATAVAVLTRTLRVETEADASVVASRTAIWWLWKHWAWLSGHTDRQLVRLPAAEAALLAEAGISYRAYTEFQRSGRATAGEVLAAAPPSIPGDATRILIGREGPAVFDDPVEARQYLRKVPEYWYPEQVAHDSGPRPLVAGYASGSWSVWDDGCLVTSRNYPAHPRARPVPEAAFGMLARAVNAYYWPGHLSRRAPWPYNSQRLAGPVMRLGCAGPITAAMVAPLLVAVEHDEEVLKVKTVVPEDPPIGGAVNTDRLEWKLVRHQFRLAAPSSWDALDLTPQANRLVSAWVGESGGLTHTIWQVVETEYHNYDNWWSDANTPTPADTRAYCVYGSAEQALIDFEAIGCPTQNQPA